MSASPSLLTVASRRRLLQPLLFAVCVLVLVGALHRDQYRRRPELKQSEIALSGEGLSGGSTAALIASLGGFRYLAADLLWLESDKVWHSGDWWAMVPLLEAVTSLDPHFILAWRTLGWHQAWNLNAASTSQIEKDRWIDEGVKTFKKAIRLNPTDWEMNWELAWLYMDRTKEYHKAAPEINATARLKDAPSFIHRFKYRVYEKTLEIPELKKQLEANLKLFPKDDSHQRIVRRDWDYWFVKGVQPGPIRPAWNDPAEHQRIILQVNTTRHNRNLPPYLYPGNPYWEVDPKTGKPVPKGTLKKGPAAGGQGPEATRAEG